MARVRVLLMALCLVVFASKDASAVSPEASYKLARFTVSPQGDAAAEHRIIDALVKKGGIAAEDMATRKGVWVEVLATARQLNRALASLEADGGEVAGMSANFEILSQDASADAARALTDDLSRRRREARNKRTPEGIDAICEYGLGSVGGYPSLSELNATMWAFHDSYPDIISRPILLTPAAFSVEGRPITAVRMGVVRGESPWSDNVTAIQLPAYSNKPRVLYTGLHHAREPASATALIYFMCSVVRGHLRAVAQAAVTPPLSFAQYTSFADTMDETAVPEDEVSMATAEFLLNEREIWIVPAVNPDGYEYNRINHPTGGGLHRKNRRPGCNYNAGIDLNRNYGRNWGSDDGSSSDKCDDTYRGASAFSEPETVAVRDFSDALQFSASFNYHTWGNAIVYSPEVAPVIAEPARQLALAGRYTWGTDDQVLGYTTSGNADDYFIAGDSGPIDMPRSLSFTPEVGMCPSSNFRSALCFWPSPAFVLTMIRWGAPANVLLASMAGAQFSTAASFNGSYTEDTDDVIVTPGTTMPVVITLTNTGRGASQHPLRVLVVARSPFFFVENETFALARMNATLSGTNATVPGVNSSFHVEIQWFNVSAMPVGATVNISFVCRVDVNASRGLPEAIRVVVFEGDHVRHRRTLRIPVGRRHSLSLGDYGDTGIPYGWIPSTPSNNGWKVVKTPRYTDGSIQNGYTYTLRPSGTSYQGAPYAYVTTGGAVDLRSARQAYVRFDAQWDIESMYDMCSFQVSTDGWTWTSLPGLWTREASGIGIQDPAILPHGWDGSQVPIIRERIDLDAYIGKRVLLRFVMASDGNLEKSGFAAYNIQLVVVDCAGAECPPPTPDEGLSPGAIVGIVIAIIGACSMGIAAVVVHRSKVTKVKTLKPPLGADDCEGGHASHDDTRKELHDADGAPAKDLRLDVSESRAWVEGEEGRPQLSCERTPPPPPYSADSATRTDWLARGESAMEGGASTLALTQSIPRYYYCDDEGRPLTDENGSVCYFYYGDDQVTGEKGACFCFYAPLSDTVHLSAAFPVYHGDIPGACREERPNDSPAPTLRISEALARALSAKRGEERHHP
eukprot:Opistho-2@34588